ncbi:hypothetical protein L7F22_023594 [Adiantum nelumboides]|nr:hypothetical protein [Adiantum nelumboides]
MRKARRFRGVRQRHWGSWVSEIRHPVSKIRVWLGTFSSAEEAAAAYDEAARILCGSKARTNFPTPPLSTPSSPSSSSSSTAFSSHGQFNMHSSALSPSLREKLTRLSAVDRSTSAPSGLSPAGSLQDILAFAACIGRSKEDIERRNPICHNAASMAALFPQHGSNSCSEGSLDENHDPLLNVASSFLVQSNATTNAATTSTAAYPTNMQLRSEAIHEDMCNGVTAANKDAINSILAANEASCCTFLSNANEELSGRFGRFAANTSTCGSQVNADGVIPVQYQHFGCPHPCLVEDMYNWNDYSCMWNMQAELDALSFIKTATYCTSRDVAALPQDHTSAPVVAPASIIKMNKSLRPAETANYYSQNSSSSAGDDHHQDMLTELINDLCQSSACSSFSLDSLPELPFS